MTVSIDDAKVGPVTPALGVTTISLDFDGTGWAAEWLEVNQTGHIAPLVLNVDFTVSTPGATNAVLTLTTPANGADQYVIYLVTPLERTSDMQLRGEFKSEPFNVEMDRIWQRLQYHWTMIGRKLGVGPLVDTPNDFTPTPNRVVALDAEGDFTVSGSTRQEIDAAVEFYLGLGGTANFGNANSVVYTPPFGADALNRSVENRLSERLSVHDFGAVGDGVADDTTAIQNAVNYASHNGLYTIYFPPGHYTYQQVYLFYEATLNPGFQEAPLRHAKFRFVGDGSLSVSNVRTYNPFYGTVLEATEDGVVVSRASLGHDGVGYPARKFQAEQLTFVGNKAGQYVIEAASCPFMSLHNCMIYQRHVGGHGILARSAWLLDFDHCYILGVPGSTGTGVAAGTSTFAGLYTMRNCLIDTWKDGIDWQDGEFTNVAIVDTAIQRADRDSIRGSAGTVRHLGLSNVYFEGPSREHDINGIGSTFKNIEIDRMCVVGAHSNGTSHLSDKVIQIDSCDGISLRGFYGFRIIKPVLNVDALTNAGVTPGVVEQFAVANDFSYTGAPVFLFSGLLPEFGPGVVWPGYSSGYRSAVGKIRLFDPAVRYPRRLVDRQTGCSSFSPFALGQRTVYVNQSAGLYPTSLADDTAFDVAVSAPAGTALYMPTTGLVMDGRLVFVKSNPASVGDLVVRNAGASTLVCRLKPGQAAVVSYDGASEEWVDQLHGITRQSAVAALQDNTGGTADGIIGAVTGSGADVAINNNFADLTVKINALRQMLQDAGIHGTL